MKISIASGERFSPVHIFLKKYAGVRLIFFVSILSMGEAKSQNCNLCTIPSFPSVTVYQTFQTGHGIGFGLEAGTWKKDAGKFSYFIGTSMVWAGNGNSNIKTNTNPNQTLLSFYVKGQYKVSKHLYVIAAPGVVNLSNFEFLTGLRYVVPVTRIIGIGIEPAYAFYQKQFAVNVNLHFALR